MILTNPDQSQGVLGRRQNAFSAYRKDLADLARQMAAIAASGDVNVNSIAPGIAAALVATVAGLGVAIPALFGYNYLGSRIKDIDANTQVFADQFINRIAEHYG